MKLFGLTIGRRNAAGEGTGAGRVRLWLLLPPVVAILLGLGLGVLAASLAMPGAPGIQELRKPVETQVAVLLPSEIEVEMLAAPVAPPPSLQTPGKPHQPALYALLLQVKPETSAATAIAGPPHRLSGFAQMFWSPLLLASPEALPQRPAGPPHLPALYALLIPADDGNGPSFPIAGQPHRPAELAALLLLRPPDESARSLTMSGPPHVPNAFAHTFFSAPSQERNAGAMVLWNAKPDQSEPGRLLGRSLPSDEISSTYAGLTIEPFSRALPEMVLSFSLEATTEPEMTFQVSGPAPADTPITLRSTWTIARLEIEDTLPDFSVAELSTPVPDEKPLPPDPPAVLANVAADEDLMRMPLTLEDAPMIAIIIDDLGLSAARAGMIAALPAPLTLSFMPYGENVAALAAQAAGSGHELFLHLPMQPLDSDEDPGPHALLDSAGREQLLTQLAWNLDRFGGYVGVNNHMGSLLTQDAEAMDIVMAVLGERKLMFVDSVTASGSVAYDTARRHGLPAARRDLFIDNVVERNAILARLYELEDIALAKGYALGIGHPHEVTASALAEWIPSALERGFRLVPASAIVNHNEVLLTRSNAE